MVRRLGEVKLNLGHAHNYLRLSLGLYENSIGEHEFTKTNGNVSAYQKRTCSDYLHILCRISTYIDPLRLGRQPFRPHLQRHHTHVEAFDRNVLAAVEEEAVLEWLSAVDPDVLIVGL